VAANEVQQPPTHHQSNIQRQQQHRQTPRVSFLIFSVVLKNTDCCLFKFIFSVAKGTNPTFFKNMLFMHRRRKKKDA